MTRRRKLSDLSSLGSRRTYPNEGLVSIGKTSISVPKHIWSNAGCPRRVTLMVDHQRQQLLIISGSVDDTRSPIKTVDRTNAAAYRRVYIKTTPVERKSLVQGTYHAQILTIENQKAIVLQDALKET